MSEQMNEHADIKVWPNERLVDGYNNDQISLEIPHNPERTAQIKKNMSLKAFEIMCRVNDETLELEVEGMEEPVGLDPNNPDTWDGIESCD